MKRATFFTLLILLAAPFAVAQSSENAGEFTLYGDYFRVGAIGTNFYGVGGRLSFNLAHNFALEGETAYDFDQNYSSTIPCLGVGCAPTIYRSGVHVWDGLFGPKIQTSGPIKLFAVVKGGFVNFAGGNPNFPTQVGTFGSNSTYAALYPGVGLEGYIWKIGLRLDVGDQIYFNNGAQNNLKVSFGPSIRF